MTPLLELAAKLEAASGVGVPAGCDLVSSKSDEHCGCPEEEWDTPWGYLFMHLNVGEPSDYHLDRGDDEPIEVCMTVESVEAGRKAGFAWAAAAALKARAQSLPPAEGGATSTSGLEIE